MANIETYIKPELLVMVAVLYVIGMMIKNSTIINDKYIPSILGVVGVVICSIYVIGTEGINALSFFTAFTQGILVAGSAVYVNQLIKQSSK